MQTDETKRRLEEELNEYLSIDSLVELIMLGFSEVVALLFASCARGAEGVDDAGGATVRRPSPVGTI